jgi:hypothetical protein
MKWKLGGHRSPSREGSHPPLLAGLLTLASSDWPPSQPMRFSPWRTMRAYVSGILASPPRSQWRGRAGFSPASLLSFKKHQKQITPFGYASYGRMSSISRKICTVLAWQTFNRRPVWRQCPHRAIVRTGMRRFRSSEAVNAFLCSVHSALPEA